MLVGALAGQLQQRQAGARKTRVMRILILMVAAFLVSWLPLSVINILRDFDVDLGATISSQLFFFSNLFHFAAMTSVVWNPLLYFWLSKYRRRDVRKTVSGFASNVSVPHISNHQQQVERLRRPHHTAEVDVSNGNEDLPLLIISPKLKRHSITPLRSTQSHPYLSSSGDK